MKACQLEDTGPKPFARMTEREANRFIQSHDALVKSFARRFSGNGVLEFDDAFAEAQIALLRAVKGYDPAHGWKFGTYAGTAMFRHLHRLYWVTRGCGMRVGRRAAVVREHGGSLTEEELMAMGITPRMLENVEQAMAFDVRSLANLAKGDENQGLNLVSARNVGQAEVDTMVDRQCLEAAISWLEGRDSRRAAIVRLRLEGPTYRQMAAQLGVSYERVRQLYEQAVVLMRGWAEREARAGA